MGSHYVYRVYRKTEIPLGSATRMKGTTCFLGSSLVMNLGCTIYEPETKRASMQWKHPASPAHKKFKVTPSAVRAWLRQQPKEFYAAGFQGLVKRWDKCLNCVEITLKNKCCFMSLSPFVSFQSLFVTLIIDFPSYKRNGECLLRGTD